MKYRIKLHHIEDDDFLEVWQARAEKGRKPRYFGRNTNRGHEWYYLCDAPDGLCERDFPVPDSVELAVCDKNWKELFKDGNGSRNTGFESLEELCGSQWANIGNKPPGITKEGFRPWILGKATRKLNCAEEDNWVLMWHKSVESRVIHTFKFLNEDYAIFRRTVRHDRCDACWYEYYAGRADKAGNDSYDKWYGYLFSDELSAKLMLRETKRYVLDPVDFPGYVITTMHDGEHNDYGDGETLEQLRDREGNPNLQAVSERDFEEIWKRYEQSLQGPFEEITQERYTKLLECLPPMRWRNDSFFLMEGLTGTLHQFCFKRDGRYFEAARSTDLTDGELDAQINEFMKQLPEK